MWDALLKALGSALGFFYDVIPSYGVAIILLTITARVLLLPLTIKQTRSMHEMQKIQPQLKAIQQKYKGNRQKVSEETMKLYKEHKVNPLGGCLPLVLQFPIFIALFSVLRATIPVSAAPVNEFPASYLGNKEVFCWVPGERSTEELPPAQVVCDTDQDGEQDDTFEVLWPADVDGLEVRNLFTACVPAEDEEDGGRFFSCQSTVGSKHLPPDSDLFEDIVEDRAQFLGLHLSCGATQVTSEDQIRTCAPPGTKAGGPLLIGYYGLIALMVLTTWYQTKQMQRSSQGGAPQMQMMGRIMPIFLGFISLSIPAGVLVYWVTTNLWQVGQQHFMLRSREQAAAAPMRGSASLKGQSRVVKEQPKSKDTEPAKPQQPPQRSGSKNARSRKKRRKR
ncbi:MAG TPA: YidC/Oxa1 family membrane protein insertase [Actinomycetota bacterium]